MPVRQVHQSSAPAKPRLLDQVRETIRRKHYSIRTEEAYVDEASGNLRKPKYRACGVESAKAED